MTMGADWMTEMRSVAGVTSFNSVAEFALVLKTLTFILIESSNLCV